MSDDPNLVASSRIPVKTYEGERIAVTFDGNRCVHFAACLRGAPEVFDATRRPWIVVDAAPAERVAEVVASCPSGALTYTSAAVPAEEVPAPVVLTRQPNGQVHLRGAVEVRDVDHPGEVRVEHRMVACGCGRTTRAPYCSGACLHATG